MEKKRRKAIGSEIWDKEWYRDLYQGRAIIANVYRYLKEEYEFTMLHKEPNCDLSHLRNIQQRTADATGVCSTTVSRILKEERGLSSLSSDGVTFPMKYGRKNAIKKEKKIEIEIETVEIKIEQDDDFESDYT